VGARHLAAFARLSLVDAVSQRIDLSPRCSLSPAQARLFFGSLCAVCLGIAAVLSLRGFWPILPFAGLEMAAVGFCLKLSLDRRHRLQTILITDNDVRVTTTKKGCLLTQVVFPRHWARVKLRPAAIAHHPSRLFIESAGRACEIGSFLTDDERREVARQLHRLVGRISESPPLSA